MSDSIWTYNRHRASLQRNGKFFAIVTPDGRESLSEEDAQLLLAALNSGLDPLKLTRDEIDQALRQIVIDQTKTIEIVDKTLEELKQHGP